MTGASREERDALAIRHGGAMFSGNECPYCDMLRPCDVTRLLDALDEAEQRAYDEGHSDGYSEGYGEGEARALDG